MPFNKYRLIICITKWFLFNCMTYFCYMFNVTYNGDKNCFPKLPSYLKLTIICRPCYKMHPRVLWVCNTFLGNHYPVSLYVCKLCSIIWNTLWQLPAVSMKSLILKSVKDRWQMVRFSKDSETHSMVILITSEFQSLPGFYATDIKLQKHPSPHCFCTARYFVWNHYVLHCETVITNPK